MNQPDFFNKSLDAKMAYADAATAHANSGAIILAFIVVGAFVAMFLYFNDLSRKFEREQLSNLKETMSATNAKKDLEIATLKNKLQEDVVIPEPVNASAELGSADSQEWAQPVVTLAPELQSPVVDEDELTAQYLFEAELERSSFDLAKE